MSDRRVLRQMKPNTAAGIRRNWLVAAPSLRLSYCCSWLAVVDADGGRFSLVPRGSADSPERWHGEVIRSCAPEQKPQPCEAVQEKQDEMLLQTGA